MRKARRQSGMTVQDFAVALGVTASALSQYETDRVKPREIVSMAQLVQQLTGVPAAWILGLEDSKSRTPARPVRPSRPKAQTVGSRQRAVSYAV